MSRSSHINQVLQELAVQAGVAELQLDASDRPTLIFDEIPVTFAYANEPTGLLWLYADLGEIPAEGSAAPVCLLQLGLATWAASAMTIGLDDRGTRVIGFTTIAVAMLDFHTLKEVLERLLDAARPIRARLAAGRFELETPPPPAVGPRPAPEADG